MRPPIYVLSALGLAVGLLAAGCGRSAPEGAAGVPTDGPEPAMAGIQVTSQDSVVPPSPTTASTVATTTTTVPTTAPGPAGTYVVQAGDTLSVIAEQFGLTVEAISAANGITDVNTIQPGQELIIPGAG